MCDRMVDREKVIKGLECCNEFMTCKANCPYRNDGCREILSRDAIALLKAQQARVMTLSGVRNLKQNTPVWLEDVDKKDVIGALFMRDYSGTKCVDFAIVRDWEHERITADYMDYGIRWRVWTSRPDQATREAIPWE